MARAAVAGSPTPVSLSPHGLTKWQARTRAAAIASAASLPRLDAVTARAGLPLPSPTVQPTKRAVLPLLATVTNLDELKTGPRRLLELLHSLASHVCRSRGYACTPSQVTYHQSQELLALSLGVTTKTVQRWTRTLEALELVATRAHFGGHSNAARVDGLVIAVSLKAGHRARLHHEDLAHQWRDLEADRLTGKTAWAAAKYLMSGSVSTQQERTNQVLEMWAVTGCFQRPPFFTDSDISPRTVLDVAYTLPLLGDIPPRDRPALVSKLASALAHGLNDHHSTAWYASLIWQALEAEQSGLTALQPLAALLTRLWTDCKEWPELRRPGALLASRLAT